MQIKGVIYKIFLFASIAILFSSGHIENPDTQLRLTQARFLIDNGSIQIEEGYGEISHGNLATNSYGQKYSVYNPGQIVLLAGVYYASSKITATIGEAYHTADFLTSFMGYAVYSLIIMVFWKIGDSLKVDDHKKIISTLIFAFTSYCFAAAQDSYEHIYESLFILIALWLLITDKLSNKEIILSALSVGIGLLFRSSIMLALPGIMLLLNGWKNRVLYITIIIPFLILILYYNYARFGSPFENGYAIAWQDAFGKTLNNSFSMLKIPKHLFGMIFSFGKGLVMFSPSIILILWGIKGFWKTNKRLLGAVLLIVFLYLLLYSANFAWHGSAWNWGPRYITPIVPLLYLGLYYTPLSSKKIIFFISIISLIIQILAVSTFYKRELVKILIDKGDIFWSDEYFFSPLYSPIKGQAISFIDVCRSTFSDSQKEEYNFKGPWKNESRPASQKMMIDNSVDFNTFNFWWVRIFYSSNGYILKICSTSLAIFTLYFMIKQIRILWRSSGKKKIE